MNLLQARLTHRKSVALLVLVAVMWSAGGMLIKRLSPGLHPLGIASGRSAVAALTILAFARPRRFTFTGLPDGT